jgi:cytoskeleton protein RodZ
MTDTNDEVRREAAAGEPLGLRLRKGREAMGLSPAEAGERLKLPVAIVEAMERDDHARLGAAVFARGHLGCYARMVGVPQVLVESALAPEAPPPLHTTVHVPRSHYLIDRYARRAVYVVLTASIVLPVVWLATRDQLPGGLPLVSTLDAPAPAAEGARELTLPPAPDDTAGGYEDRQVVASMAPFYREQSPVQAPQPPAAEPAAPQASLDLSFVGPSWVEVVAHDGRRLAFGLVAAGEERSFDLSDVASVSIGDADAVEVSMAGEAMDLAPFRRAKVARFTLSSDGEPKPASG